MIANVKKDLNQLLKLGNKANGILWKALINPTPILANEIPDSYYHGSNEEVHFCVRFAREAFKQTNGAL